MSPLGEVLLLARGSVPLPEGSVLTAVASALLNVSEPKLFGLASPVGLRPLRHNCGRGVLVDIWRLGDLNKVAKRRFSPAELATAEDKATERAAGWRPSCPYCGSRPGYCACHAKAAQMRADNTSIGDDELMVSLHRKFAANDRNHVDQAERENRRRGRKIRSEAQNQADLPADQKSPISGTENQGLTGDFFKKRAKVGGRYVPRGRGPSRKLKETTAKAA